MKSWLIALTVFMSQPIFAQTWMGEISAGGMAYTGDLTQHGFSPKRIRPAAGFNIKYESGDLMNVRIGGMWGMLTADDKDNKDPSLSVRNLNFTTHLIEGTAIVEFNLFDPEITTSYPYLFGGVGVFYFNPYTYDKDNKKVYLHSLNTEGQGLPQFPDRKQYKMTQVCLPVGIGWKWINKNKSLMSLEFGYRVTFTDYLDDVSKNYIDPELLAVEKGVLTAELSYRKVNIPFAEYDQPRGNSAKKDLYYVLNFTYSFPFTKKKDKTRSALKPSADTKSKKEKSKGKKPKK